MMSSNPKAARKERKYSNLLLIHVSKSQHNLDSSDYKIAMSFATGYSLFSIQGYIAVHSFIIHEGSFQLVKQGRSGPLDGHAWGRLKSFAELPFLKTCTAIHSYHLGFVPQREQFPLTTVKCLCPNENDILEHAVLVAVQVISFIKKKNHKNHLPAALRKPRCTL